MPEPAGTHASLQRCQGMMMSANLREGATYWSNAGFTNLVYCSMTPATSRPRTATSRWILQQGQAAAQLAGALWMAAGQQKHVSLDPAGAT